MPRRISQPLPDAVQGLRQRLDAWRRRGPKGHRLPEALWSEAEPLARAFGVHRVAKALGLNFDSTKRRIACQDARIRRQAGPAGFFELELGAPLRPPARSYLLFFFFF
jgi:hypothetical protein